MHHYNYNQNLASIRLHTKESGIVGEGADFGIANALMGYGV